MSQQAQKSGPVTPPPAGWLHALVGIPAIFALMAMFAFAIGVIAVVLARGSGHPWQNTLSEVNAHEAAFMATLKPAHPVRFLAGLPAQAAAWLAPHFPHMTLPAMVQPFVGDGVVMTSIVARRTMASLGLLAPLLVVLIAAAQDGLAQRELRKYGADPESAFLFHQAKGAVSTTVGLSVLVYLLIPTAIHPHLVLSVIAPITGFSVALAVTRFKKYL